MTRHQEPADGTEREIALGWLAFHRDALASKCAGLDHDSLVRRSAMPSLMTVLGLVRHMTEMERIYAAWALAGDGPLTFVYGDYTDGGPEWDFDCDASMVDDSLAAWERERAAADAAIAGCASMDAIGTGNRRSLRWNLAKLVQEYARHNGHADIVRELIDGATGE
jgi:hypothetical protein